jgi:L-threonylcarbamoyladenylate synthase
MLTGGCIGPRSGLGTGIERAAAALRAGGVIIMPTDTVYGLGADARSAEAVRRLFAVKQRPWGKAVPVLLAEAGEAEEYVQVSEAARMLISRFWPGGLTLVLPARPGAGLAPGAGGPDGSVGLRVPADATARAIIAEAGCPVAAPSANRAGAPPPATFAEAQAAVGELVDAAVDGGPCRVGEPSTVLSLVGEPRVLRVGGVSADAVADVLGCVVEGPGCE